jgi:NADH-quinone oxidoreductase subunit J
MIYAVIDWHQFFFVMFASLACVFALGVLFFTNIVRMAFSLILALGATAGLFFLAGAEFLGAMQLLIYVGGTLVLLVFGVMLTSQSRFVRMQTSAGDWVIAALVGGSLLGLLLMAAFRVPDWTTPREDLEEVSLLEAQRTTHLGLALSGLRVDRLDEPDEVKREGMSGYLLPFVIVSVHLLIVLIGAAYLARPTRRVDQADRS